MIPYNVDRFGGDGPHVDLLHGVGQVVKESSERLPDVDADLVGSVLPVREVGGPDRDIPLADFVDEELEL